MTDAIRDFWGAIVSALGAVIWLVRLEAKALGNESEIKRLWRQRREDLDAAEAARKETAAMLTEIRMDVKQILAKR